MAQGRIPPEDIRLRIDQAREHERARAAAVVPIPVSALAELVEAAVAEGAEDRVAAAIAHIALLARQQGFPLS